MNQKAILTIPSLLALCAAAAPAARAADSPVYANDVRLGAYFVFYHTKADDLSGAYVPSGVNLSVRDVQTLYAAYVRRLSSRFDVELAFGWPPVTKTVGRGPATLGSVPYDGQVISTARWVSPTLLVEYKFLSENSPVRPYLGLGVNYTTFIDRNSTAAGNAASGGPTRLSLSSSVGPAVTLGMSYQITSHWASHISYSWSQIRSNLTADTAGTIRRTHIDFGPQALVVSVGYSF
ncbi:MAG: outer membrane beta-barrel protein [Gammaproteobacteria bacterium]|nr:outer membrane beta-barrel protein [Gammaproteobacteria bacterium]